MDNAIESQGSSLYRRYGTEYLIPYHKYINYSTLLSQRCTSPHTQIDTMRCCRRLIVGLAVLYTRYKFPISIYLFFFLKKLTSKEAFIHVDRCTAMFGV